MTSDPVPLFDADRVPVSDHAPGNGNVTAAARATLAALDEIGVLEDRHQATAAMILALADAVDQLTRYGGTRKGTPLALLARELREALATLPDPPVAIDSGWEALADELRTAARNRA